MSDYTLYNTRINANGITQRDRLINNQKDMLSRKLHGNPALRDVELGTVLSKINRQLVVISTDKPNIKKIISLPDETFSVGQVVIFQNSNWIIDRADVDDEIYVDGQMTLAPNIIKFQDSNGTILSYPYFVETSLPSIDENKTISTSDTTKLIKLPFDQYTQNFYIDKRFMGDVFNGVPQVWKVKDLNCDKCRGLLIVSLIKDIEIKNSDNVELGICDYFEPSPIPPTPITDYAEITYSGSALIKAGGSTKSFTATFKDVDGNVLPDVIGTWTLEIPAEFEDYITNEIVGNLIKIRAVDVNGIIGITIGLKVAYEDIEKEIQLKVGSLY